MVFSGGVWQTEGGGKKTKGGGTKTEGGGEKKTVEGGGTKMGGRRRRSHMLLEVQSDLVIHWLFKTSWQSIQLKDLKKTKIIQNIFSSHESNAQMSFSD